MRKFIIHCCLFFMLLHFSQTSKAQLSQGTWLVGGNGMYSKKKSNFGSTWSKSRDIDILPNIGYFVADKFATGLRMRGYFTKSKYLMPDGTILSTVQRNIGIGPFARYYFLNKENRINVFANADAFYNVISNNSAEPNSKEFNYGIAGGAALFFNSAVALEMLMEYRRYIPIDSDVRINSIQVKVGLQFHLE